MFISQIMMCACFARLKFREFAKISYSRFEIIARNWAKSTVRLSPVLLLKILRGHFAFPAKRKNRSGFAPFEVDW